LRLEWLPEQADPVIEIYDFSEILALRTARVSASQIA